MVVGTLFQLAMLLAVDAAPATVGLASIPVEQVRMDEAVEPRAAGHAVASWSTRDGFPAASDYLSVDAAGLVYVWSGGAIHRFDGSRFTLLQDGDGHAVRLERPTWSQQAADGAAWYSSRDGEILRITADEVHRHDRHDGLPSGADIRHIVIGNGVTLAATTKGLYRRQDDRWSHVALKALDGQKVWHVRHDGQRWWMIVGSSLVTVSNDLDAVSQVATLDDSPYTGLVGDAQHGVWLWQESGTRNLCRLGERAACHTVEGISYPQIDVDGSVRWVRSGKLYRFVAPSPDGTRPASVLVLDTGLVLDELQIAPDGAVWLLAGGRLLRLSRTPVERLALPMGAPVATSDGDVWIASFGLGLMRVGTPPAMSEGVADSDDDGTAKHVLRAEFGKSVELTLVRIDDLGGGVLGAATLTSPHLWISEGDAWRAHPPPPLEKGAVVRGIARDAAGRILVGAVRDSVGLHRFEDGRWQALPPRGEGRQEVSALRVDRGDRIWLGHNGGLMTLVAGDTTTVFGVPDGLDVGTVREIYEIDGTIWVAGQRGIARLRDGRFEALRLDSRMPLHNTLGLALDDERDLWIGAAQGILRVSHRQWPGAFGDHGQPAGFTLLGELDGVEHPIAATAPSPVVAKSTDGRLWFMTAGQLYRIDPTQVPAPRAAPTLAIASIIADGARLPARDVIDLPAGVDRLVLPFHAQQPVAAERTAFRYRVSGVSDVWNRAGSGEVVLDRLPPGRFTVELQASTEDGEWTGDVTKQSFVLPPTFWQSAWSGILLALLVFVATAVLFLLRARQQRVRRHSIDQAKLREREKIARDLHDTLLQGVNGLLMSMQAVAKTLEPGSPPRGRLESTIAIADRVIVEGRDRVSSLRSIEPGGFGLERALRLHAMDLQAERDARVELHVEGMARALRPCVEDELSQIGREALTNAFVHARAAAIAISVCYQPAGFVLTIEDDGAGLPAHDSPAARPGWGLTGMRERAALIGARLAVVASDAGGVRVTAQVPARRAYVDAGRPGWWDWLRSRL